MDMNVLEVLRLDVKELEDEYRKIASNLEKLGMTEYEARLFVALIIKNHGTADELAELAMVPRTSAYKALQSLAKKGFVTVGSGRPIVFHPIDLELLRKRTLADMEEMFDKLNTVKGLLSEKGTPELVYTIVGKKRVMAKIGEMIDAAQHKLLISSPMMKEIRSEHASRFKDAVNRGVEVVVIIDPLVKAPPATAVYRKKDLMATDVICDGKMAILASPDLDLSGFSDNPFLAEHLDNFLRMGLPEGTS